MNELRTHVLRGEQQVLMAFPGVRPKMKEGQNTKQKENKEINITKEHNYFASQNSSRYLSFFLRMLVTSSVLNESSFHKFSVILKITLRSSEESIIS